MEKVTIKRILMISCCKTDMCWSVKASTKQTSQMRYHVSRCVFLGDTCCTILIDPFWSCRVLPICLSFKLTFVCSLSPTSFYIWEWLQLINEATVCPQIEQCLLKGTGDPATHPSTSNPKETGKGYKIEKRSRKTKVILADK